MKLATQAGVPVVPYGGGTGVMGAAVTTRRGIVLDMGSMDKVIDVSLEDRLARVQPGVVLKGLDEVAHIGGFFVAHDPWSQPVATVGGAISTNGVGYLAAKYGPMGRQVLSLEVVLPTGEIVRTPSLPQKVRAGMDLNSLFIGTEGVFGVITEATIRIYPELEERRHYALEFPSFQQGFFAVARLYAEGIQPVMVDFTEEDESDEGGQAIEADAPGRSVLHLSLEGGATEVDALETHAWEIVSAYGGRDMGPEEAQRFWEERHISGERYAEARKSGQRHPWQDGGGGRAFSYIHTAVPISKVLELRYKSIQHFEKYGLKVHECAIWGEPEMFSVLAGDPNGTPDGVQRLRKAADEMIGMAIDMGGTLEYCHGVGLRLKHLMSKELGEGGVALLKRIKAAVDPAGIMNPGKLLD
jgi:FAD/FMN-containing dehydrogenase